MRISKLVRKTHNHMSTADNEDHRTVCSLWKILLTWILLCRERISCTS